MFSILFLFVSLSPLASRLSPQNKIPKKNLNQIKKYSNMLVLYRCSPQTYRQQLFPVDRYI